MPRCQGLRRHPDRQAAALLERPVVFWPVGYPIARPGDLVAAWLIGLVGHRSSRRREKLTLYSRPRLRRSHGPRFMHQDPLEAPTSTPSRRCVTIVGTVP